MNCDEAKQILLLYRHGTADADDPQIAGALALAKRDPDLARWLEAHCARQFVLQEKFRQIQVPAGLKEQIISEARAARRKINFRPRLILATAILIGAILLSLPFWFSSRTSDDSLAVFQKHMASVALRGYRMDLMTTNLDAIRAFFAQQNAPTNYVLSAPLQNASVAGCAVESWQNSKVAMICFQTGRPLAPGAQSDLWLFVADADAVKNAPVENATQFAQFNELHVAVWKRAGKIYLLGSTEEISELKKFL